jgi:hypothetical protein
MINLRTPGDGPLWLPAFAASIVAAFKSIMAAPFRLWNVATAGLPPAADWKQGLIYDSTTGTIRYSDGTSWIELKNAGLFVLKAGDTMTGPLVISKAGADGDFDLVDTNATSAGGGGRIRIRSTKPTAAGHRIGVQQCNRDNCTFRHWHVDACHQRRRQWHRPPDSNRPRRRRTFCR